MIRFTRVPTPLGALLAIAEEGALIGLHFEGGAHVPSLRAEWREAVDDPLFAHCAGQIAQYLAGQRGRFDLPLAPRGTQFQRRVWREIAKVPYGETIAYATLAARAGAPGAARATGAATGRNPLSILVPCHRIVAGNGSLTGYAGGIDRKQRLLALEGTSASLRGTFIGASFSAEAGPA